MNTNHTTTNRRNRTRALVLGGILLVGTAAGCGSTPEKVGTEKPYGKEHGAAGSSFSRETESKTAGIHDLDDGGVRLPNRADGPLAHRQEVEVVTGLARHDGPATVAPNPANGPAIHRSEARPDTAPVVEAATEDADEDQSSGAQQVVAPNPSVGPLQHRL